MSNYILTEDNKGLFQETSKNIKIENGVPYELILRQNYVTNQLGSLVCWNMPTFVGMEIANPDLDPDTFAPTGLDIDQWLTTIVSAGCKYAILTTKHHDGFALWPTMFAAPGHSPYSIAQTSWYATNGNPDVVNLFINSCRSYGILPGLYFSIKDSTYETRGITSQVFEPEKYKNMIKTQLTELLTNYGFINYIWLDGWGWSLGYEYITYSYIYNFIKSISQDTLIIENSHIHPSVTSEIETYEQNEGNIPDGNVLLAEAVQSIRIDDLWFYNVTANQTSTAYDLAAVRTEITQAHENNGTFLLNATPDKAGALPAAQVTFLDSLP